MTTVAKEKLVLFKKHSQPTRRHTYVYITPSTLLEARSLGCILQTAHTRKSIKKRIYEYIVIFMQGQVSYNDLCTLIILSYVL